MAFNFPFLRRARKRLLGRAPFWLTAGLLGAVLALSAGSWWYVLQVVRQSKEEELSSRLKLAGQMAAEELVALYGPQMFRLSNLALDLWPPESHSEETARYQSAFVAEDLPKLQAFLAKTAQSADLRSAMIVDVRSRFIADSVAASGFISFQRFDYLPMDVEELRAAMQTRQTQTTPYYSLTAGQLRQAGGQEDGLQSAQSDEIDYMRSYTPLEDEEGRIYALLRLEASRDYFAQMKRIQGQILALSAAVTALLAVVALIFHRLVRSVLQAEKAMAQSDRLESVATLAAGFAHEVRNPLGIIRSCAEGLAEEVAEHGDGDAVDIARDMVSEVERMNGLITQFLDFARPADSGTWRQVDVARTIQSVLALARKDLEAKQLRVEMDLDAAAPAFVADERALRQVFLNILLNARDATPEGGSITFRSRARRGRVVVTVEDTGRGIAEGDLRRVFDPFFTTKPGGSGLGLALSRNIVAQFGGDISIRSQLGRGTVVEMSFRSE